jgi:hypothetical protein
MLGPFLGTPPPRNDKEKNGSVCRGLGNADSMPSDVVAFCSSSLLGASVLPLRQELVPYAGYFDRSRSFSSGPPYATAAPYSRTSWKLNSANFVMTEFSEVRL